MIGYKKKYGENIILVLHLFQKKKKLKIQWFIIKKKNKTRRQLKSKVKISRAFKKKTKTKK